MDAIILLLAAAFLYGLFLFHKEGQKLIAEIEQRRDARKQKEKYAENNSIYEGGCYAGAGNSSDTPVSHEPEAPGGEEGYNHFPFVPCWCSKCNIV